MFVKPISLLTLFGLLSINTSVSIAFLAQPSLSETVLVCLSSSPRNQMLEIDLIDRINRIKLNAERALNEIKSIETEINSYSGKIDKVNELGEKLVGWDGKISGLANIILTDFIDIPGLDVAFNKPGWDKIGFNLSKSLLDVSKVLKVFTPSNLADWIKGTSLSIAESKLTITSNSAEAVRILSKQLRSLRAQCQQEKAPKNPPNNRPQDPPAYNNNESIVPSNNPPSPPDYNNNDPSLPKNNALVTPIAPFNNTPFTATIFISFVGNDRPQLINTRDLILGQLGNPPMCSVVTNVTDTKPITQSPEEYKAYISSLKLPYNNLMFFVVSPTNKLPILWNSSGNRLEKAEISYEDNLQTQYLFSYSITDFGARMPIGGTFTFFKDNLNSKVNADPNYMKKNFEEMVNLGLSMTPGYTVDKSTVKCNF